MSKLIGLGVGVLALLVITFMSMTTINSGTRGVLTQWSAAQNTVLEPGFHLVMPVYEGVIPVNVQVQQAAATESASTHDLQNIQTTVSTNWNINPEDASYVVINFGSEQALSDRIITPAISNAVKAVTANYDAAELITKRELVRQQIEDQVRTALTPYRVVVDNVNITDFQFSQAFDDAIEQKQIAQQNAQKSQYTLQQSVIDAQATVAKANGQAESQKLLQQTITPAMVQYLAVQKWDGSLPTVVSGNGSMPFIGNLSDFQKSSTPTDNSGK